MERKFWTPLNYAPTAVLGFYITLYGFFGERVPVAGGLGFDGQLYGALAIDLEGAVRRIHDYYLVRLLPSALVWITAKALGHPIHSAADVVQAFHVYNSVLLVCAALFWGKLADELGLPPKISLFGAASLFLNWAVLKQYSYFAVQTDVTAFALGTALAWAALTRRYYSASLIAFVGSFAWPVTFPLCALLVLFSRPIENPLLRPSAARLAFAGLLGIVAVAISLMSFWSGVTPLFGAASPSVIALPLSALALFAYVFCVARAAPFPPFRLDSNRWNAVLFMVALWALQIGIVALAKWQFSLLSLPDFGVALLFKTSAVLAIAKPAIFLVAHIVFFGPAVAALLYWLPETIKSACGHSAGAVAVAFSVLSMLINPETRIATFGFPILVGLLCLALKDAQLSWRQVSWYAVACVIGSKCYLPLNALGYEAHPNDQALLQFPYQWEFMNIGPWIGWAGYWVDLGLLLVVAAIIYFGCGMSQLRYRAR